MPAEVIIGQKIGIAYMTDTRCAVRANRFLDLCSALYDERSHRRCRDPHSTAAWRRSAADDGRRDSTLGKSATSGHSIDDELVRIDG